MIKIICVGKLKEKFYEDAVNDYYSRIKKYTNIEILEVKDEGSKDIKNNLTKERDNIFKLIKNRSYIIVLDINGLQINSKEFSLKLENLFINNKDVCFIIGGSFGLHKDIKEKANDIISFSKMTFPHQLFRIILLEQIYRAYKISNNESYHK